MTELFFKTWLNDKLSDIATYLLELSIGKPVYNKSDIFPEDISFTIDYSAKSEVFDHSYKYTVQFYKDPKYGIPYATYESTWNDGFRGFVADEHARKLWSKVNKAISGQGDFENALYYVMQYCRSCEDAVNDNG